MANGNGTMTRHWVITALLSLCTLLAGYCASQLTLASEVEVNKVKIGTLESQVDRLVTSMDRLIDQNTRLISKLER